MKKIVFYIIGIACFIIACSPRQVWSDDVVKIPTFNFPQSIVFEHKLSAYNIFEGNPADLIPSKDFHLLELSSALFTDYAHKQRLVKIPPGTQMMRGNDDSIDFPDGTILTKTFFYQNDERDTSLGKRIIETRLEIKDKGTWNIATYVWNQAQTEATLAVDGSYTKVNWITADGNDQSTLYHIPSQNDCLTCHQSNSALSPIGPTLRNLNRMIERNGASFNQLTHLQATGVLNEFEVGEVSQIADYKNASIPLAKRARAYLDMNCAHCHNPSGWDKANERQFDFRYETLLDHTGILYEEEKIVRNLLNGDMPFIGTTLLDREGVQLIIEYLESL